MACKWLRELEKEYPELAETARRLNADDGFVMDPGGGRRRRASSDRDSDGDGEGDGNGVNGKRKKKGTKKHRNKRENDERRGGGDSGSGGSSPKRGRKYGSDGTAGEDSFSPPSRSGGLT